MNHPSFRLGQCLGTVSSATFRRRQNESLVDSLGPRPDVVFAHARAPIGDAQRDAAGGSEPASSAVANHGGVNCLAIDDAEGRYLFSGGADASIRMWDLEQADSVPSSSRAPSSGSMRYAPRASILKGTGAWHTHALTSVSVYPFDPTPATLLTTSYDKTLKVVSVTPSSLQTVHTFDLEYLPHTHSLSPLGDSSPLIAVGTAHPSVRLLDLRSGLSTHSLAGPNGAVYTLAWSPKASHILASGSTDGRVLFYDIRRANAAFASLDHDDAVGVVGETTSSGLGSRAQLLDFAAVAHSGPVTGVQWTPSGDKIVTAGHDQRIRVWDAATGKNDLVHFGPRVRNERQGELKPLVSPMGMHAVGKESLFWPNDDGRGAVFQHHLREGHLLRILQTDGIKLAEVQAGKRSRAAGGSATVTRLTSGGRINAMLWRVHAPAGHGLEMYTAHGDGRICVWTPRDGVDDAEDGVEESMPPSGAEPGQRHDPVLLDAAEQKRKRKRELIEDLLGGLTRRPATFS